MTDIKIFADIIDDETRKQIDTICEHPAYKDTMIRVMPDTHAGCGCVIGFTAQLQDKVVPNVIGVDLGCLDKDTEVLTPKGWIKISEYSNEDILVYDHNTELTYFSKPLRYIKERCDEFYHFYSKEGLDQMLSAEHVMLIWHGSKSEGYSKSIDFAKNIFEKHNKSYKSASFNSIKTTFDYIGNGLALSDNMIRLIVMICADGCIRKQFNGEYILIELHLKEDRKIERAKYLLEENYIPFKIYSGKDLTTFISFKLDQPISKDISQFYSATKEQLRVILDESLLWDGDINAKYNHKYYSNIKSNADLIQFACAVNGVRARIYTNLPKINTYGMNYNVYLTENEYVSFPEYLLNVEKSIDGFKYCFTTKTGFFIIRRNDNISITGNCGVQAINIGKVDVDLEMLDDVIKSTIPSGFNIHKSSDNMGHLVSEQILNDLICKDHLKNPDRLLNSCGTLGGGNHFIEMDVDAEGNKYLIVHSGSRNLGLQVAGYYQDLALQECEDKKRKLVGDAINHCKAEGRCDDIEKTIVEAKAKYMIPKDLAYLEDRSYDDYILDSRACNIYAEANRNIILGTICREMGWWDPTDPVMSVHNYIDPYGMSRKGAISAHQDKRVIIPLNMRDGCILGVGKGNADWNFSAPHGAGRLMGRKEAMRKLDIHDFERSMGAIYSSTVCKGTLDEAPQVYKPMEDILRMIEPTVEIKTIIKPIYNFKAVNE